MRTPTPEDKAIAIEAGRIRARCQAAIADLGLVHRDLMRVEMQAMEAGAAPALAKYLEKVAVDVEQAIAEIAEARSRIQAKTREQTKRGHL